MSAITRETAFDRVGRIRDEFILEADISALLPASGKTGKRSTPSGFVRFMQSGWGTFAACAVVAVGVYVALLGLGRGWFGTPSGHPGTDTGAVTEQDPVTEAETEPDVAWSSEGLTYISKNDGTCSVDIVNFKGTALRIPETSPDGDRVVEILGSDLSKNGPLNVEYCYMPDTITAIGFHAFYKCTHLTYVRWSAGLQSIGFRAFAYTPIRELILPDSVTRIESCCFQSCYLLEKLVLPAGLTEIGPYAFNDCFLLSDVTFGKRLETIGSYAFANCKKLTSVDLPAGLVKIGDHAFAYCEELAEITMHVGLEQIEGYAFEKSGVKRILFDGTKKEFEAIEIFYYWDFSIEVICTDGKYTLPLT